MFFPIAYKPVRPSRLGNQNTEEYHIEWARYIIGQCNNSLLINNSIQSWVRWRFYLNQQWIYNEDLEPFLLDETGDARNRIRWSYNIIEKMVNSFVGNAIRQSYEARAYNASPEAAEAKQDELAKRMQAHKFMNAMPLMAENFMRQYNLGSSPEETLLKLEEEGDEDYLELATNELIRSIEKDKKLQTMLKRTLTRYKAVDGISILKKYLGDGCFDLDPINLPYFFYDHTARLPDLSDAEYMGDYSIDLPPHIFELCPDLSEDDRKAIDTFAQYQRAPFANEFMNLLYMQMAGRIPRYNCYWKDSEKKQTAYFADEFGYHYRSSISEDKEDENYFGNRLPEAELTDEEKEKVGSNNLIETFCDIIRHCEFIPKEIGNLSKDVLISYGVDEYAYRDVDKPAECRFPYYIDTYEYYQGIIVSPIDSVIDPQRMMNRFLSMAEADMNTAPAAHTVVDKNLFVEEGAEEEFRRAHARGGVATVDARGISLPNAVFEGGGEKSVVNVKMKLDVVEMVRQMVGNVTGFNDTMQGLGSGERVLKSVQQSMLDQGALGHEDFFAGQAEMWTKVYEDIAGPVRMMYADYGHELTRLVNHRAVEVLQFTKDQSRMKLHLELNRVKNDDISIQSNNALLLQLKQMDLISEEGFGKCFNRSELDEVVYWMRVYSGEKREAKQQAEQQQGAQQQDAKNMMLQNQQLDQQNQNADRGVILKTNTDDNQTKIITAQQRNQAKLQSDVLNATAKQKQPTQ